MPHTMTPFFYRHRDLVERVHATTLVGNGAAAWESRAAVRRGRVAKGSGAFADTGT